MYQIRNKLYCTTKYRITHTNKASQKRVKKQRIVLTRDSDVIGSLANVAAVGSPLKQDMKTMLV